MHKIFFYVVPTSLFVAIEVDIVGVKLPLVKIALSDDAFG
jgi:hypothetical protein